MKTQFSQLICDGRQVFKWGKKVYQIIDLESLSATALYTGKLPPMGPGGFGVLPTGNSNKKNSNPSGYPTNKAIDLGSGNSLIGTPRSLKIQSF